MFEIDRIPSYVKEAMAQIGIREEQVELSAFVDMTVAQERAEVYLLASGDTLFSNSVGRTDLWSGNTASLRSSLDYLGKLDGSITIYPGHGEPSTLASALESAKFFF